MSFLAPLYLLAGLAISLPIAFHMIRRTPRGRQMFSSLMFLSPSPPRMTKRNRIEDWLLLVLRGLAICLLALAFARPFLRAQESTPDANRESQRLAILLDTSASMRRPGYWEEALSHVREVVAQAGPMDQLTLLTFDTLATEQIGFEDWSRLPVEAREKSVEERLKDLSPGWSGTELGRALISAADRLEEQADLAGEKKTVVLISDMQLGGHWEALDSFTWPADVTLRLKTVGTSAAETNASIQLVSEGQTPGETLRVRLYNTGNSSRESFRLGWQDEFADESPLDAAPGTLTVYVAPGQSRVVPAPMVPEGMSPTSLALSGDDVTFDNLCHVIPREPRKIQIVSLGSDEPASPDGLRFFLGPLFPSTSWRQVEIVDWPASEPAPPVSGESISWLLLGGTPDAAQRDWVRNWGRAGGQVLFVARNADQATTLYELLGTPPQTVAEADLTSYAMLGKVDLSHPALRPFDDARYSDFTKLRFWHYRKFAMETLPGVQVLAAFEDGAPALAEIPLGQGRIVLLASGWNRNDSDLAVWSKFVPLMNGLLDYVFPAPSWRRQAVVGDDVVLSELGLGTERVAVRMGGETTVHAAQDTVRLDRPGRVRFSRSGAAEDAAAVELAVNLPADESRTEPYPPELLAAAGVRLEKLSGGPASKVDLQRQERQLLNRELESRQQYWRWLVVAALGVLGVESILAAWTAWLRREQAVSTA